MDLAVLIIAFFVLLFLGIPIAIALCASAILYLALYTEIPFIIIGQQMLKGVDSFTLMAIPFFVIAGIMLIVAATQAFGWVITRAGIPQTLAQSFTSSITNPLVFVFAVCVILLVAGCFIDAVPALLIFAPIFCPTADAYGINMIYFGVVMVIVLCIGLATPPVGINLYVASSVGGQPVHKIIPHLPIPLLAIFVGTVIVILVPEIITFLPNVL